MAAKTLKTSHRLQTVIFIIYQKGEKTKIRKEKPKITYSVALVIAFLAAENENRHLEHLSQADFRRVPEKNSSNWKLRQFFVFVMIQRIFSSWALSPKYLTTFY